MSDAVTAHAVCRCTHVRPRRHAPETRAGQHGRMLTICTRCRTPYDRRQADPSVPAAIMALCPTCGTGALREPAPVLATVAHLGTQLTVLPRSVLPVAS